MDLCWGTIWPLSDAIYNSALAFLLLFAQGLKISQGESLGSSWVFPGLFVSVRPALALCTSFLIGIHTPYYPWISFPIPFLSRLFHLSVSCPSCCPLPQAAASIKWFCKNHPGRLPIPGNDASQAKPRQAIAQVLQGAARQVETHNHNCLKMRSVLLPLALGVQVTIHTPITDLGCGG